jgi:hypothetical protein
MSKINISEILKNVNKYHYYISSSTKTIFLSSSNDKKEARELALQKLAPNIKNLIGKNIILVSIKNVESKYNDEDKLNIIGGPITFEIQTEIIKSENKISSGDKSKRNVYLSEKFIKKNISDITVKLKDVINDYKNNELNLINIKNYSYLELNI